MFMAEKKPKTVIICGPTGIGKTSVAIDIASAVAGEIISADSMQVYRYMDIATAKPNLEEQRRVRHHLIDIVNPDENFDAAQFSRRAHKIILKLYNGGIAPLLVGGTGLYIKAAIHGLFDTESANPDIRKRLKKEADISGSGILHKRLNACDPDAAGRIHPNDTYRIIRALELHEATGKPISEQQDEHGFTKKRYKVLKIGLKMERKALYKRIDHRVDIMIQQGLLDEVKGLLNQGYSENLKSMQSIGYRHMVDFIKKRLSWDETLRIFKRDTRRYAKRQMTWFNADPEIVWTNPNDGEGMILLAKDFLHS
jgi:tRNA dimethylallyltransferase